MRQFLILCDEKGMAAIQNVSGGTCQFLEVQGMPMEGGKYNFLVNPIPQQPDPPVEAVPDVVV